MRANLRTAMDRLMAGKDYRGPSLITRQRGEQWENYGRLGRELPTLYSYGRHFPLVILSGCKQSAYLNAGRYSPTTSRQQGDAAYYLSLSGYAATDVTVDHKGHRFQVYRKAA